jgi:hypothetical protein
MAGVSPAPRFRTRVGRAAATNGTVLRGTQGPLRPCPKCDARPGEKCRVWMVREGVRLFVIRTRAKSHPERNEKAHG